LRAAVEEILPEKRPGDFNQAMMDLGETVCLPNTSPCCNLCPLRAICAGYYEGMSSKLPFKSPRKPRAIQQKTVLIFISEGKVLLHRRPASGLLAGLWEFPNFDGWLDENNVAALLDEWGISSLAISKTAGSRHIFTHMEWHIQGYLVYSANALPVGDNLWAEGAAVSKEYAIPSAFKFFTRNLAQWLKYI
jgi:A/G-specific adenine glycosylase